MTPPEIPVAKYTPPLFKRMDNEQRKQVSEAMRMVVSMYRHGDSPPNDTDWSVFWAREFLRVCEETKQPEQTPLSAMVCGCEQGSHEERRNTGVVSVAQHNAMTFCRLGWPVR